MRFPIYSHCSNPAIDRPIIRKKINYIESLLDECWADWIDEDRPELGILLRGKFLIADDNSLNRAAGSGFDTAWSTIQSGYAGPLVWQLKTGKA